MRVFVMLLLGQTIGCAVAIPCERDGDCPDGATCAEGECGVESVDEAPPLQQRDAAATGTFTALAPRPIAVPAPDDGEWTSLIEWTFPTPATLDACARFGIGFVSTGRGCTPALDGDASFIVELPFGVREIEGGVQALSVGDLNAFEAPFGVPQSLSQRYVDGVSITSGDRHVWSFAAGKKEDDDDGIIELAFDAGPPKGNCPCSGGEAPPSFVGESFSCEPATNSAVLWDGAAVSACDRYELNPVLSRHFDEPLSEPLRIRVVTTGLEAVELASIALWVR